MASPRRPLTGVRLTYVLEMGGEKYRVRIKESIGKWLGLKPVQPETGEFGASGLPIIPGLGGGNIGRKYLKSPAGFRFQSYIFLLQPGSTITEPVGNCKGGETREREICTFSLGFGKGKKSAPIARWRVQSWVANSSRAKDIVGFITPSGVKHVWKESTFKPPKPTNPPGGLSLPPGLNITPDQVFDLAIKLLF